MYHIPISPTKKMDRRFGGGWGGKGNPPGPNKENGKLPKPT